MVEGMNVRQFIERQRELAYAGFVGTTVHARIPIKQAVVDDVMQAFLAQCNPIIQHLQVTIVDHNRLEVLLVLSKWHITRQFVIDLEIEPFIDVARAPLIRLWLPRRQRLLGTLGQLFTRFGGHLPQGIYLSSELIEVDLGLILFQHNLIELLRWLKFIELYGQPGVLVVEARLAIEPQPPVAPQA